MTTTPSNLGRQIVAGLMVGVMGVSVTLSFVSLIFSGDLAAHLGRGVGWALAGLVVAGTVAAVTGSFPGTAAGPQDAPAVVIGAAATGIALTSPNPLATLVAFILITSVVTGALLILMGQLRLGDLVRYVPYPVVAGFLGGTGLVLLIAGVQQLTTVGEVTTKLIPGLAFGFVIAVLARSGRSPAISTGVIVLGFVGYHAFAAAAGLSAAEGVTRGLLMGPFPAGGILDLGAITEVAAADWSAVVSQVPAMVAMALIVPLAFLLNVGGLEQTFKTDIDVDRELNTAGFGMLATGPLAAIPGYVYFTGTVVGRRLGGASRIPPLVAAGFALAVIFAGPNLLSLVPVIVPAGLLVGFGLDLIVSSVWEVRKRVTLIEYAVIVGIVATIGFIGLVQGVGLGLVAATVLFAIRYARTTPIRALTTVSDRRSSVQRNAHDEEALAELGQRVVLIELQGYLFFGTAEQVVRSVRRTLQARLGVERVVIDLTRVIGMDSSAASSFDRLGRLAEAKGFEVIISGDGGGRLGRLPETLDNKLFDYEPDLDRALETIEEDLLERAGAADQEMFDWSDVPSLSILPGEAIISEGDLGAGIFFLERGRASVDSPHGRRAVLLSGSVIGELSHLTGDPAMATVRCDVACIVRHMSPEWLATLTKADPTRALQVERLIAQRLAAKLNAANRTIRSLQ